ncbi:MAG: 4,5-DOPA dioxygenase extradiol [Acidimicrobiales bacterium]
MEDNRYTDAWSAFGSSVPRPRAILMISAHWYINATAVTAMRTPRTIHDFFGFPPELFAVEYSAPGDPTIAEEIVEAVKPEWVGLDSDSWGIDHGTWSVLRHAFPDADVPVIQLSINAFKPLQYHLDLAARLAPLRERGILIMGSGNVVHNLQLVQFSLGATGFDWAYRFDDRVRALMSGQPADILAVEELPEFALAVPTPDHFIPLLYVAALAAEANRTCDLLVDGALAGSLTMTAYTLDNAAVELDLESAPEEPDEAFPDPAVIPPDETNL